MSQRAQLTIGDMGSPDGGTMGSCTVDFDREHKCWRILATKYPHHFCDILKDGGDATTGDVLIQCALFGEIVYG